jgi:hypothetical protein
VEAEQREIDRIYSALGRIEDRLAAYDVSLDRKL